MQIPLSVGSYEGRSGTANSSSLVNMLVDLDAEGGSSPFSLFGTPGLSKFSDVGKVDEGRGGYSLPGTLLVVVGNRVFSVNTVTGVSSSVGILSTSTGAVQFAENPDQVMIIDGALGYVYTKATGAFAKITDADFPVPLAATFKDGYGVVVESSSGKFFVSAINDFTSWDALAFTTAEYEPDNLVACLASHDSLFAFGVRTTQTYYNSGDSTFPFDNRQGANMQIGCGATNSPAKAENIILWLDEKGMVRKLDGYAQIIISTRQIEWKIANLSTFADAVGSTYTQEGHTFYMLVFPTGGLTLVYDLSNGLWHERESGTTGARYRCQWIVQEGNKALGGDFDNGLIYELDPDVYGEDGQDVRWEATLKVVNDDNYRIQHSMLELRIESGVGLTTGQGNDPQIVMQYSDDDGNTWSSERWGTMGKIGEYQKRVRWYGLGVARSRTYRISGSDPVKHVIVAARLEGRKLGF